MQQMFSFHLDMISRLVDAQCQVDKFRSVLRTVNSSESGEPCARHCSNLGTIDMQIVVFNTSVETLFASARSAREAADGYTKLVAGQAPHLWGFLPTDWRNDDIQGVQQTKPNANQMTPSVRSGKSSADQTLIDPTSATMVAKRKVNTGRTTTGRQDRLGDFMQQRRGGFRAALQYYQGRGSTPVTPRVIEYVKQRLCANKRDLETVSRAHVACILRSSRKPSFSRYYRDISLIHSTITGQPAPDVSRYETELMLMFGMGFLHIFFSSFIGLFGSAINDSQYKLGYLTQDNFECGVFLCEETVCADTSIL